ncbi:MAG: hypothetical protein CO143_01705 [Candidatus Moranbacteria bacterium CG_4_9_14_3_um_filter_45_14]|nr:MAG: hypothetical protein AUK19_03040 [Candidatus Moranbacteria bacterium CG2_30_45_14]PJA85379.1 MAG: hypothetical protein CO143_01705 [Candidatus Moranbacteria bacterium CG_4_9_14_3_um_filter_45_14]
MLLIAEKNPYVSEETVLFDDLVRVGEEKAHIALSRNLRLFLVSCLIEHLRDTDIVWRILALDFLESDRRSRAERAVFLKRCGDASLILAGFFPERALRLHVSSTYFRQMGRSFFGTLATHLEATTATVEQGRFFNEVARGFEMLERVLNGARGKAQNEWEAFRRFRVRLN